MTKLYLVRRRWVGFDTDIYDYAWLNWFGVIQEWELVAERASPVTADRGVALVAQLADCGSGDAYDLVEVPA